MSRAACFVKALLAWTNSYFIIVCTKWRTSTTSVPISVESGSPEHDMQDIQREKSESLRSAAKAFIAIQTGGILAILPICLLAKLPADWLFFPLLLIISLFTISFILLSYGLRLTPYLGQESNEARRNKVMMASMSLTQLALVILVATAMAYLITHRLSQVTSEQLSISALPRDSVGD